MKTKLKRYSHIVIGIFLVSLAFNLFLSPYDFVTGGVSGLSIIIRHFIPLNESLFMILCNALLLILSYFLLGKEKNIKIIRYYVDGIRGVIDSKYPFIVIEND